MSEQKGEVEQIYGFKELLQIPSMDSGGEFEAEQPHLPSRHEEWVEFLETLFPCSRIVLNLRRDRAAPTEWCTVQDGVNRQNAILHETAANQGGMPQQC